MNDLEQARRQISEIDAEMAKLFERRMNACKTVAAYKKERGLPVRDPVREAAMAERYRDFVDDPVIASYYVRFLKNTVDLSCDFQTRLNEGMKVAYCGVEGAYANIAAKQMFPAARLIACDDFAKAYNGTENGLYDCVVLPLENSFAGEVGPVMDLIFSGELFVNQVTELSVRHCLIARKGTDLKDIKTVISHPQALEQCADFIRKNGFDTQSYFNTAAAAKYISECEDSSIAAIASEETAKIFGLEIISNQINDSGNNTTRFAALSRVASRSSGSAVRENENFILVFTVQNRAGALAQTLNIIGAHGYNMRTLRSRPMKDLQWNYFFYIEAEGNINTPNGQDMLRELSAICARLKLVGTYYTDHAQ